MAVERADVCVIMIDANEGFTEQDSKVAGLALEEGKACIIAVNKWDAVEKDGTTMDSFRNDVKENMTGNKSTFKPFTVRVSISNLNIRKGAGTSYNSIGACPKGVYTIVETKKANGYEWGKLKSGLGWIALNYTTRL